MGRSFITQSQGLALEGTQCQDKAKPPPRVWNAPLSNKDRDSTKNGNPMLAPDLNRGMTAGKECMDNNARLDIAGRSHGTKQGLVKVIGKDRGTRQARLETQEGKAHENSMETPRENDKLTLEQPAQGIDEQFHEDSKPTELKLNPYKNTTVFRL